MTWQKRAAELTISKIPVPAIFSPETKRVRGMLDRWPESIGKQNRWLGFIQGWAYSTGVTVETLKIINRDCSQEDKN